MLAAVVQLSSSQDVTENLERCEYWIEEAAKQGVELVVLPENFAYVGALDYNLKIAENMTNINSSNEGFGPILGKMKALANKYKLHLLLGGMPARSEYEDRYYNTAVLLDKEGYINAIYRKMHLFDINISNKAVHCESKYMVAGNMEAAVGLGNSGFRLGLSICYDLRFPELYRKLVTERRANVISVSAAFTQHTGKDHWMSLLRARAIENQVYILAAGQIGDHYGHSCIIDPWGTVVTQCPEKEGVAIAKLDLEYLQKVRRELPCLDHRNESI